MNACPVCKPYSKPGYQEQVDGPAVPCYACNRAEFVRYALRALRTGVGSESWKENDIQDTEFGGEL